MCIYMYMCNDYVYLFLHVLDFVVDWVEEFWGKVLSIISLALGPDEFLQQNVSDTKDRLLDDKENWYPTAVCHLALSPIAAGQWQIL